ncbi:MAG: DUF2206 domain-containing protein [Candidatus Methanospirare jalkutatii]|nr:DUF2206 domain-containing protein [Candidatus Methanospirare jalkutatii]
MALVLTNLDKIGACVLILRQIVSFICLFFIPGFLLLHLFKVKNTVDNVETILYSLGLSFFFIISLGTLINFIHPLVGFYPFSKQSIIITSAVAISILCIIFWKYGNKRDIEITANFNYVTLFLSLLPFLAILGTFYLYYFSSNHLILFLFLFTSITPLIVAIKGLPKDVYPLAIWLIALSLVFYNSLFGHYMRPTDNICEFYLLQNVLHNGIWDITIPDEINAMPGVMVTLPIYSLISGLSLVHIYKIVVPLLSSFIPVGLYKTYEKKFGNKIAFLSSFFFLSMFNFFTWSSITMKMVSSGIFLSLLILLIVDDEIDIRNRKILELFFAFSLIGSHYGTSYIFMFALIACLIILIIASRLTGIDRKCCYIAPNFVVFYITLVISWYMYTARAVSFEAIVLIGRNFVNSLTAEFIFPKRFYTTQILLSKLPEYLEITKYLYIVSFALMCIGVASALWDTLRERKIDEYMLLSISFLFFLLVSHVAGGTQYGGGRAWVISGYFLAPFVVIGCINFLKILKIVSNFDLDIIKNGTKIAGIFLCVFFLFNSGFAAEVIWNYNIGASIYVSAPRITKVGSIEEKEYFYRVYLSDTNIYSSKWLSENMGEGMIFTGAHGYYLLYLVGLTRHSEGVGKPIVFDLTDKAKFSRNSYVYLTKFTTETGKIQRIYSKMHFFPNFFDIGRIFEQLNSANKIYTNGGSEIYYR